MIYMIDALEEPTMTARLCEAFLRLSDAYASSLRAEKLHDPNDISLQIVPLRFIASTETLILPRPHLYKSLAFEVYDKCAPGPQLQSTELAQYSCVSAVHLAKPIPRHINFKLTSKPTDGSPLSDRCIHVAYRFSSCSRWLTASWVDNHGCLQWNASYHLAAGDEELWPRIPEVAADIWETTLEMARLLSTPYRLFIVKIGPMSKDESDSTLRHVIVRQYADKT